MKEAGDERSSKTKVGLPILWEGFPSGWRQSQMHSESDTVLMAPAANADSRPIAGDT